MQERSCCAGADPIEQDCFSRALELLGGTSALCEVGCLACQLKASCRRLCLQPGSAAVCVLTGAAWHEPQSNLQISSTLTGLGGPWERLSCELMLVAASTGLELLSKMYRAHEGQMLIIWGLCERF